jgi:tetratricopeptide (TPR) repeat protein
MTPAFAVLALLLVVGERPAAAQDPAPAPAARRPANAAAMYEFLLARRAEAADDVTAAQSALERAVALDPQSPELHAELAAFHARQNRPAEAVAAAERAVALDAGSEEGHRILGLVHAAWADGVVDGPSGGSTETWRAAAILHLTKVQSTPAMVTDLGLQVTLARQLMAAGQADKAVPILERVVAQTGAAGEPVAMLADAHRTLGQVDRAASVLEQAAAANPRLYLALGDLYERQRKFEEAASAFEKGVKGMRTPGRELRLRRAAALLNIPDGAGAERAVAALTEFLASTPKDLTALYLLAQAHQQRGDATAAITAARQALAVEAGHLPSMTVLASIYREQYDFAAIETLLARLDTDEATRRGGPAGETVRLLAELGGARQQRGDNDGAVRAFERAHRLLPESAGVAAALAQAHVQARQYDQATRVAKAARQRAADDAGLIRIEAIAGVRAGRAAEAVAAAEAAFGSRKGTPEAAFALADVYQEAKQHEAAIAVLGELAAKAPDDDAIAFRLAAAYESAGRVADAERAFRAIVARDPLHANALNYLGYMLANRGLRLTEALAFIDRALAAEPGNPAFLDSRGWALLKLGRAVDAEGPLRTAADALRSSSVIQSHYADVLVALGKRGEAADRLELALAGDGVDVDRAALERRLRQLGRRTR